jgi:hypothetical protein
MSRRTLATAALLGLAAFAPAAAQSPLPSPKPTPAAAEAAGQVTANPMRDSLAHSRRLTAWFFGGHVDSVRLFIPVQDLPRLTAAELQKEVMAMTARAGTEVEVIEEKFAKRNGNTQYWRTSRWTMAPEPVLFRWAFNQSGQIIGIGFGLASQAPPIDP